MRKKGILFERKRFIRLEVSFKVSMVAKTTTPKMKDQKKSSAMYRCNFFIML
jgi:hypothetical protein